MKFCAFVIFAMSLALVSGCQGHGLNDREHVEDAVQWGPAVNGLQVGLAKRTYEPGKAPGAGQIYFVVQMRNVTGHSMSILAPIKIGGVLPEKRAGNESVGVMLVYDSAAGLKTAAFTPADKPVVYEMEPGKDYNLEARLAPSRFGIDRFLPGRMTAAYSNAQASIKYDSLGGKSVDGLWTGEARSGSVAVEVGSESVKPAPEQAHRRDKLEDNPGFVK
jgi:hypothetical protein